MEQLFSAPGKEGFMSLQSVSKVGYQVPTMFSILGLIRWMISEYEWQSFRNFCFFEYNTLNEAIRIMADRDSIILYIQPFNSMHMVTFSESQSKIGYLVEVS